MTRAIMGCVVAGLLTAATAGVLSIAARAQNQPPPAAGADKTLEGLLKEARIDYTHDQEGLYRITIEINGEATVIVARERPLYKDQGTGKEVKLVLLWSNVAKLPEGFKPPLAMLQRMAQINDNLLIGNVSLGTDSGIRFNSSFWLRDGGQADPGPLSVGHALHSVAPAQGAAALHQGIGRPPRPAADSSVPAAGGSIRLGPLGPSPGPAPGAPIGWSGRRTPGVPG